eukprot:NODE_2868_length_631_cov_870.716495_g1580_i2.p3 GENE.NODE_2868_length_631_cov_870.716495_g1580_i2~~NODE_2868_length_631_cov_870.716495_g1580_i2.p3  ORF type:complete len:63 (-),score=21.78 NODE_2868_length_631_cov_870.716495_g1580_i2:293-481(-)
MDFAPEVSLVDQNIADGIEVDDDTLDMLKAMEWGNLSNLKKMTVTVAAPANNSYQKGGKGGR